MAHIKNPERYWLKAYHDPKNQILNIDLEYFFQNPYSYEKRIFDVISYINNNYKSFNYVTNYRPYYITLTKLPNVIIDTRIQKIILIPYFYTVEHARSFYDPNYNDYYNYIINNLNTVPSNEFLQIINNRRFNIHYFANNFQFFINQCEKNNSIKIIIDMANYYVTYIIKKSVTFSESPIFHYIPKVEPSLQSSASELLLKTETLQEPESKPESEIIRKPKKYNIKININDPTYITLKKNLISYLSGNISRDKLIWINSIYDYVFSFPEFVDIANNNKLLKLDMKNKVLKKIISNPEDD